MNKRGSRRLGPYPKQLADLLASPGWCGSEVQLVGVEWITLKPRCKRKHAHHSLRCGYPEPKGLRDTENGYLIERRNVYLLIHPSGARARWWGGDGWEPK
jgi:hypothetical protein